MTYIYALIDPRTDQPYYVGKTTQPATRETQHLMTKRLPHTTFLQNEGVEPTFTILRRYSFDTDIDMMEQAWINRCIDKGCELENFKNAAYRFVSDEDDYRVVMQMPSGALREFEGKPFVEPSPIDEEDLLRDLIGEDTPIDSVEMASLPRRRRKSRRHEVTEEEKRAVTKVFDVPI